MLLNDYCVNGRVGPKNPTQKTRKKPTAKKPSYLGFMGFLKKMAEFRMKTQNK